MDSTEQIPEKLVMGTRRIGRVNTLGLWTLYWREVWRFVKVWTQTIAAPAVTTLLFMAIFVWALSGAGRAPQGVDFGTFLAPGLVIMAILQNAFQNPSSSIIIGKVQGSIVDVLMPPLSPLELTVGYVGGGVTRGILVGLAVYTAFFFWPDVSVSIAHPLIVAYFALSASVMMSLVGVLTGIWAEKFDHAAAINNFIITPLSLLSGTFYTIRRLPEVLQDISAFNPFFYMIDGLRYGFIDRADSNVTIGIFFTLALNLALAWVCYRAFKTGYKLKA